MADNKTLSAAAEAAEKEIVLIQDLLRVPSPQLEGLPPRRRWKGGCIIAPFTDVEASIEAPFPEVRVAANTTGYTFSPILAGAKFTLALTVGRNAPAFHISLQGAKQELRIQVNPAEGSFAGTTVLPAEPTRGGNLSGTELTAIDFLDHGQPFPGNTIPATRFPVEYAAALEKMPAPAGSGSTPANAVFAFSGKIPVDRRLILDDTTIPAFSAAWEDVSALSGKSFATTFRLVVGGTEVAQKFITIPVHGLPDLTIVKPKPDVGGPEGYCDIVNGKLRVVVRNQGTTLAKETTTRVTFAGFGEKLARTRALEPGGDEVGVEFEMPDRGTAALDFTITADANNELAESNKENNTVDGRCGTVVE